MQISLDLLDHCMEFDFYCKWHGKPFVCLIKGKHRTLLIVSHQCCEDKSERMKTLRNYCRNTGRDNFSSDV